MEYSYNIVLCIYNSQYLNICPNRFCKMESGNICTFSSFTFRSVNNDKSFKLNIDMKISGLVPLQS